MTIPQHFSKGQSPSADPILFPLTELPPTDPASRLVSPILATDPRVSPNMVSYAQEAVQDVDWSAQLAEVEEVRQLVKRDQIPAGFFGKYHPEGVCYVTTCLRRHIQEIQSRRDARGRSRTKTVDLMAELVHKDLPNDMPMLLVQHLLSEGVPLRDGILPKSGHSDFVSGPITLNGIIGAAVQKVSPTVFAAKWSIGMARPEEYNGKGPGFTAYQEGCPNHPSTPAMHAGAAGVAMLLPVLFDIEPDSPMFWEIANTAYLWSAFRTLAGVHYPIDNALGLMMGQQIVSSWLPGYLGQTISDEARTVATELLPNFEVNWLAPLRSND